MFNLKNGLLDPNIRNVTFDVYLLRKFDFKNSTKTTPDLTWTINFKFVLFFSLVFDININDFFNKLVIELYYYSCNTKATL